MLAKEMMNKIVTAASRKTNGRDLAAKLLSGMYSGLPVVDEGRVVGVVTEFDLLKAVKEGKDLQKIIAEDIMSKEPICVEENTHVDEIIKIMTEQNIIRVPVVRNGTLIGVISRCDILNSLIQPEFVTFTEIKMFKTILVPIDTSDTSLVAVDYAIELSKSFNSEIVGISIIDVKNWPDHS